MASDFSELLKSPQQISFCCIFCHTYISKCELCSKVTNKQYWFTYQSNFWGQICIYRAEVVQWSLFNHHCSMFTAYDWFVYIYYINWGNRTILYKFWTGVYSNLPCLHGTLETFPRRQILLSTSINCLLKDHGNNIVSQTKPNSPDITDFLSENANCASMHGRRKLASSQINAHFYHKHEINYILRTYPGRLLSSVFLGRDCNSLIMASMIGTRSISFSSASFLPLRRWKSLDSIWAEKNTFKLRQHARTLIQFLISERKDGYFKPHLHDQIFFDNFHFYVYIHSIISFVILYETSWNLVIMFGYENCSSDKNMESE